MDSNVESMHTFKYWFGLLALSFLAHVAVAQARVGSVDVTSIVHLMPQMERCRQAYSLFQNELSETIHVQEQYIVQKEQAFATQESVNAKDYLTQMNEIKKLQKEVQNAVNTANEALVLKEAALLEPMLRKVAYAVRFIADSLQLDLTLNISQCPPSLQPPNFGPGDVGFNPHPSWIVRRPCISIYDVPTPLVFPGKNATDITTMVKKKLGIVGG